MSCWHFQQFDARLKELTSRRPGLTREEWGELYEIVWRVLRAEHAGLVESLARTADECLQDFFEDKLWRNGAASGAIHHVCALAFYYKRYLLDLRDISERETPQKGSSAGREEDLPPARIDVAQAERALEDWQSGDSDPELAQDLVDLVADTVERQLAGEPVDADIERVAQALEHYLGIRLADIVDSALEFLFASGPWAKLENDGWWIRLYLRRDRCPEVDARNPGATSREARYLLARECKVPSYHQKAVKLGVAIPKGRDAAYAAFGKSYRGQWLVSLNLPVDREHHLEMAVALRIQCLVALSRHGPATDECGRLL